MRKLNEVQLEAIQAGLRAACPFCAGYRTMLVEDHITRFDPYAVECLACGADGPRMRDPQAAIEAWQGRTP